jgi:hypothetical protein
MTDAEKQQVNLLIEENQLLKDQIDYLETKIKLLEAGVKV